MLAQYSPARASRPRPHLDAVLTPTLAMLPRPVGWFDADGDPAADFERQKRFTPFTAIYNTTGQPAISLPLFESADGLPIGMMLVGRPAARRRCSPWPRSSRPRCRGATGVPRSGTTEPLPGVGVKTLLRIRYRVGHRSAIAPVGGARRQLNTGAHMSIVETVLVFVGIPALIIAVLALLVYGRSQFKGPNRYRPGKPWTFPPCGICRTRTPGSARRRDRFALESSSGAAGRRAARPKAVGGASGEW